MKGYPVKIRKVKISVNGGNSKVRAWAINGNFMGKEESRVVNFRTFKWKKKIWEF